MLVTGNKMKNKKAAFSLIEIIVSLGIFTFIMSSVLVLTILMINTQKRIQAELFLTQTAQTTLETIGRQVRYGYQYTGSTLADYNATGQLITIAGINSSATTGSSATTTQTLKNAKNSPFIIFETQGGNPNTFSDQNSFCATNGKLYKLSQFQVQTDGITFSQFCANGSPMLPDIITLESISFDIYAGDADNPKNPMVRIKLKIKHEEAGSIEIQTTVTQRLVTYF